MACKYYILWPRWEGEAEVGEGIEFPKPPIRMPYCQRYKEFIDDLVLRKLHAGFGYGIDRCQEMDPDALCWIEQELLD